VARAHFPLVFQRVEVAAARPLQAYRERVRLAAAVRDLEREAARRRPMLDGRTIWMLSATASGGGVAEMLRPIVALLRELGVRLEWLVMQPRQAGFFPLTKRLHNLVHGIGDPRLGPDDRALYDKVSDEGAAELATLMGRRDVVIVHDPQPLGIGARIKRLLGSTAIWRCHIGLDVETPQTRAAWEFLRPDAMSYDYSIFTVPEYVPLFLVTRSASIPPGIDPLSAKNCDLLPHHLVEVLWRAGLVDTDEPMVPPRFEALATRAGGGGDPGLLFRPTVTQISRWDRLKGWRPLLEAFVRLKQESRDRRVELARLVLAGPDPRGVADDPEALDVLAEMTARVGELPDGMRQDVALLVLPLRSRVENALMVNALQRTATVVVQNSLREGFGLTVTEAMYKGTPVLGTRACGIRHQIDDGIDGRLAGDAEDREQLARILGEMLTSDLGAMGRAAERKAQQRFLVFEQLISWMRLLDDKVKLVD
jgi:trehalose synthase